MPVRCGVWHHWIFVNLAGNAPLLEEHVRPMANLRGGQDLGVCRVAHRDNWETYHHIWVHKGIFNKMSDDLDFKTGEPSMRVLPKDTVLTLARRSDSPPFMGPPTNLPLIPVPEGKARFTGTSVIFPNVTMGHDLR